jgi:hypothetical protein
MQCFQCSGRTLNAKKYLAKPQCVKITPSIALTNLTYPYLQIIGGTKEYFQGTYRFCGTLVERHCLYETVRR